MNKILTIGIAALAVTVAVAAMTFAAPVATANANTCMMWYSTEDNEGTVDVTQWAGTPEYAVDAADVGCWEAIYTCYSEGYTTLWIDSSFGYYCTQT